MEMRLLLLMSIMLCCVTNCVNGLKYKVFISKIIVIGSIMNPINPCYGDYLDGIEGKNDISLIVPSREITIKIPEEDLQVQSIQKGEQVESFEEVLKLIPSWKYFKIIAKEYSSRSTNYREGQENLMAPFM